MPLGPGTRLGPYEILSAIGAGGMGEVYRARDARLNRDVAIKVLPAPFSSDQERLARFRREAQLLASLNHPHIAAIYGFEESGDTHALVLELVEGETLADRIAGGAMPADEVLPIARQICEALEAAHEHGIIHRDLKPANIKVRDDGTVKVLDFGLAKLTEAVSADASMSMSPTITSPALISGAGVLLGTAAYMAPEQVRGRVVDKRVDIWAFGCVLYEMLTGKRPFDAGEVSDTLAFILTKEPDWGILPASTPEAVRRLLRRTFEKDRTQRLADMSDARIEIDEALPTSEQAVVATTAGRQPQVLQRGAVLTISLIGAMLVGGAVGAFLYSRRSVENSITTYRASLLLPPDVNLSTGGTGSDQILSLSPDGHRLAFSAREKAGSFQLWVRALDSLVAQPIAAIDSPVGAAPFWSPDSSTIGFFTAGQLRKINSAGGPSITLCDVARPGGGASWNKDDVIVFSGGGTLYQVPASGGTPTVVMTPDSQRGETNFQWPFFLPDRKHFIFRGKENRTFVGSLGSNSRKEVGAGGNAQYAEGRLVFMRGSTLMAQSFDVSRLELTGEAVPIAESVRGQATGATFSVSQTGSVVYQTAEASLSQLRWFDRSGRQIAAIGDPVDQTQIQLSPDGTRATAAILDPSRNTHDLWIYDLTRDESC